MNQNSIFTSTVLSFDIGVPFSMLLGVSDSCCSLLSISLFGEFLNVDLSNINVAREACLYKPRTGIRLYKLRPTNR